MWCVGPYMNIWESSTTCWGIIGDLIKLLLKVLTNIAELNLINFVWLIKENIKYNNYTNRAGAWRGTAPIPWPPPRSSLSDTFWELLNYSSIFKININKYIFYLLIYAPSIQWWQGTDDRIYPVMTEHPVIQNAQWWQNIQW